MTETKTAAAKGLSRGARVPAAQRRCFLEKLADTANVARAAREAGLERSAVYRLRVQSDSFRAAWDEAMNQALDELEAVLLERATHGVEKAVFYGGKPCGSVRHYSDALGMFILKARRPATYAGHGGEPDEHDFGEEDPEQARAEVHTRLNRLAERLRAGEAEDFTGGETGQ